MDSLALSVVVVSIGRPRALARCLTALSQMRSTRFEVIVVADEDGCAVARTLPFGARLILFEQDEPNIAVARNTGISAAGAEIVAFIDDDAVPEPTWAEALLQAFDDLDVTAATGPVLGRNGISLQWGRVAVDALGRDRRLQECESQREGEALKLHGTNLALRHEVLIRTGGFDPAFGFYLDDTDLSFRLMQAAQRCVYVPGAVVHHAFEASVRRTDDRVPLSLFDIGASTMVYLRKHAPWDLHAEAIDALEADQRTRLLRLVRRRKLDADAMRALMESLRAGILVGRSRESTHPPVPMAQPGLRPLRDAVPPPMRIVSGWRHRARACRAVAARCIAEGTPVSLFLLEPTPRKHRVQFNEAGWWEQIGGLYGPTDRSEARIQAWTRRSRIESELRRIASIRGITDADQDF